MIKVICEECKSEYPIEDIVRQANNTTKINDTTYRNIDVYCSCGHRLILGKKIPKKFAKIRGLI